jgi:hypothetical protein
VTGLPTFENLLDVQIEPALVSRRLAWLIHTAKNSAG